MTEYEILILRLLVAVLRHLLEVDNVERAPTDEQLIADVRTFIESSKR